MTLKEKLNNPYFHDGLSCNLVPLKINKEGQIRELLCKTHNVEIWHCGWAKGYHYGEKSEFYTKRQLWKQKYNKEYYRKFRRSA